MQPLGGEEGPTTPTSLTSRGEAEGAETVGRGLRNPFLKRPYFTGGSTTSFAEAPKRGVKTKGLAPHELLENSELTNSLVRARRATKVAGEDSYGAGKGGKTRWEADLTGEDAGLIFKWLDDPPQGEGRPKNTPEDIFGDISDSQETLDFGRKRPNRSPVRFRPMPDLAIRPRSFLAAWPMTMLKPMTNLLHVRKFEISNFKFER